MPSAILQSVQIVLGGVDVTALARGRLWHRQETSAAHTCQVDIAPPSGAPVDIDSMLGATLSIGVTWVGGSTDIWFVGTVQSVDWDSSTGRATIQGSDGLQDYFEALDEAAVDAAIVGSKRHPEVQSARKDGWSQALDCLSTVQAGYAIGRDGVHRLTPWQPATPDFTLGPSDILEGGVVRVSRKPLRSRRNRVVWTVTVRGPILHEVLVDAGWDLGMTACELITDGVVMPPIERIASAVVSAGDVWVNHSALGSYEIPEGTPSDAEGIGFTLAPKTGTYLCPGEMVWVRDPTVCVSAGWKWMMRWSQTLTMTYTLTVEAPDSVLRWGALIDERSANLDGEGDYSEWEDSQSGSRPQPDDWADDMLIAIDADDEAAVLESALEEAATTIASDHREEIEIPCRPDRVSTIDMHHTVRVLAPHCTATGVPTAIEGWVDLDEGSARTILYLGCSRCPGTGGTDTPRVAPTRPLLPTIDHPAGGISFPTHIGGRDGAPLYDGTERGVWTNWLSDLDPEAPVYPYRAAFERPAVPTNAQDALAVGGTVTYSVYPRHDELVEVAP